MTSRSTKIPDEAIESLAPFQEAMAVEREMESSNPSLVFLNPEKEIEL